MSNASHFDKTRNIIIEEIFKLSRSLNVPTGLLCSACDVISVSVRETLDAQYVKALDDEREVVVAKIQVVKRSLIENQSAHDNEKLLQIEEGRSIITSILSKPFIDDGGDEIQNNNNTEIK